MKTDGQLEPAFILHARNYRDTSVMMDVFSRESGRYSLIAKGARSKNSRMKGQLQPFIPLLLASVGRGELKTATTIERLPIILRLTGHGLLLALYVNELLYRLLGKFDPMPDLYDQYEMLLHQLQQESGQVEALRAFELNLLQEMGYGINFYFDARNGDEIDVAANYRFRVNEGFYRTNDSGDEVFSGAELDRIASGDFTMVDATRLRHLTRTSLAPLLGDKPLKSRALFEDRPVRQVDSGRSV